MAKLEFPYAMKEVQELILSHFDPIIVAIVVQHELELNELISEMSLKTLSKKKRAQVIKQKKKKEGASAKPKVDEVEEIPEVQRDGPAIIFNLLPAYDVTEKAAEMVTFDLILNDTKLGKLKRKDYFGVAERTNRLMRLLDVELKRMNEYAETLDKNKMDCTLDMYVSTKYLKIPNYFEELLKLLEKYPKVWSRLCLTFDGYDFIDGDVEVQKISHLKDRGIKIALDTKESLYSVPEILSMYKVDYVKLPFKLFKGISSHSKIAYENTMKTISDYKVRPIVYEVDNYLEYMKCKELNLKYLQGDYMGVADNNKISNFIHPKQAVWIKNE
jgi:EAL domain-containing protein (putative c-di-GMP-specific phosphodiesterase class I)